MTQKTLMNLVNFTQKDLAANREGHLSEAQRARARRGAITSLLGPGLIGLVGAVGILVARGFPPPTINLIVAAVVLFGFGAVAVVSASALWTVYRNNRVEQAAGDIQAKGAKPMLGRGTYGLMVGDEHFGTRMPLADVVEEGSQWRVYYTPSNRLVVSMEPL